MCCQVTQKMRKWKPQGTRPFLPPSPPEHFHLTTILHLEMLLSGKSHNQLTQVDKEHHYALIKVELNKNERFGTKGGRTPSAAFSLWQERVYQEIEDGSHLGGSWVTRFPLPEGLPLKLKAGEGSEGVIPADSWNIKLGAKQKHCFLVLAQHHLGPPASCPSCHQPTPDLGGHSPENMLYTWEH